MTYLAESRDALAKALCAADSISTTATWDHVREWVRDRYREQADALIDSGAVVTADILADDEALVDEVTREVCKPALDVDAYRDFTRDHLRALAAALSERGQ